MPRSEFKVWTIVVGGGRGQRFGRLKQYELLDDRRVIDHSRATAEAFSDGVVVVVPADDAEREGGVAGGETRSDSVRAGLAAIPDDVDIICVHDAARPLASLDIYERVVDAVIDGADAAVPGIPVTDTIKIIDTAAGDVVDTPDRSTLVAVQTPQAFRADRLRAAHAAGGDATDDAGLIERTGGRVVVVPGDVDNRKITEPDDLAWTRARFATRHEMRSGRERSDG
ncbi:MAG: 2-C-methyl-D-erythritol 4-phosphate cytidylyltransferase [Ilumatobacter sp.]|uniref:IspD/TarI family cytidylyltransferase n=1 Tax=Ilumatobacter sp. TaxID=1967498 RepID=UPI00391B678E